ncbi:Uma2 family endonuclease [Dyadobacter sp. BE34]|uniref:Uma2 family endonuclease n=1 Tax=Dyadobacter fermentans TaxID=94254 RepID=A0ABU1QQ25_9BACT|nr:MULTISPECIES: Uma2 family endonuclease [Dyadobacter]MDR6803261.1 Uma2 family endonuclease [Dyadobacter fermentans]MDR7041002.1 Uma2 family endonuclease [Dyadobacter sp. BE242]MDR7195405.1 Uma2 family endonuclease [Dyadobacter sp. BE34]MDR7214050.1 Uma2 family endonuclease [Dyadobacter sp. BE31]MDR7260812.1 Uma2 family endonuclease [Dyadobacter sp. BE32]
MEAVAERLYSLEEYFAFCETHEGRFEFVNGEIIEMSGETTTSNRIAGNIHRYLAKILEDSSYELYQNAVKLRVEDGRVVRIPDFLICEEKGDAVRYTTLPLLIVEVLSESTAKTDRVEKLQEYSSDPSLQYYLMIEQTKCRVEMYIRDGERWYFEFYDKMDDVISLPYFKAELPLTVVYRKVSF